MFDSRVLTTFSCTPLRYTCNTGRWFARDNAIATAICTASGLWEVNGATDRKQWPSCIRECHVTRHAVNKHAISSTSHRHITCLVRLCVCVYARTYNNDVLLCKRLTCRRLYRRSSNIIFLHGYSNKYNNTRLGLMFFSSQFHSAVDQLWRIG